MAARRLTLAFALTFALVGAAPAGAQTATPITLPINDLEGLAALTGGQTPAPAPEQFGEPELKPVPEAECDSQSLPLKGLQGRVPPEAIKSPEAARGWTCNTSIVSHWDTPGGFRVWRYTDLGGHTCAFYDTSLLGPLNVVSLAAAPTQGVVVLDMTDPVHPKQTDQLTAPGMLSPHESLNLNAKRGLLGAEVGTAGTAPGILSLYDVSTDCRRPIHQSDYIAGPYGHESGFAPDGNTFWIGGGQGIIPVDVTNPKNPRTLMTINEPAHGLNLTDDGTTLFDTDTLGGGLTIIDVSQVQARKDNPKVSEISRLTWKSTTIPQNTNPMTINGHKYLLEYDEFAFRFSPTTLDDVPGAARIINIDDLKHPYTVSNLRLQINMQANHRAADDDPNFVFTPALTYSAHYCNIPREIDPEIAACSFINSGLRIFDIRDPEHPKEAAYFISPPKVAQGQKSDAAFSQPTFDPARREVWYTDATGGFYNIKLSDQVWPHPEAPQTSGSAGSTGSGSQKRCTSKRSVTIHVRKPKRGRITKVTASISGKRLAVKRRAGRYTVTVKLTGAAKSTVKVKISVRTSARRTYSDSRTYHPCSKRA